MLSKLKNRGKRWEDRSKSNFSHIRDKVEEVILRPLILERFLDRKSNQDQEKVVSKSLQIKSIWNQIFSSSGPPVGAPSQAMHGFQRDLWNLLGACGLVDLQYDCRSGWSLAMLYHHTVIWTSQHWTERVLDCHAPVRIGIVCVENHGTSDGCARESFTQGSSYTWKCLCTAVSSRESF